MSETPTPPQPETVTLGNRLKTLIKQRNLTAAGLSRECGISVANLSRILSGHTNPSFETVVKLAAALEVPLETFAPDSPARPQTPTNGTIRAVFSLENTDHTPKAAAQMLLQAAQGGLGTSWTTIYLAEDLSQPAIERAEQVGTRRLEIELSFPHELVEKGSLPSLLSVTGSALSGTGARLLDVSVPAPLIRTFTGPAFGTRGLRDTFNKHGRPLLACTIRPMRGLSPRLYGRAAYEALVGGVDITADPTLLHSIPGNLWRERFRFCAEAAAAASRETNEFKTHAANITAPTIADMEERALWAQELELAMVMVDSSAIGWAATQSIASFCAKNDILLCAMGSRALSGDILSEQLHAKLLRISGCDVISTGSPLRGNVSNRRYISSVFNTLRDDIVLANPESGHYLEQDFASLSGTMPAIGGGHNPWHFPRLLDATGDHAIVQCGGAIMSHPWGSQAGANACRTAMEALVQARGEGHNLSVEGRAILQKAAKYSPDLKHALDTFQEGSFLFGVVHNIRQTMEGTVIQGAPANPSPTITPFRRPEPTNED